MILFVEDALLEAVAYRILAEKNAAIEISTVMGRRGFGELQRRSQAIRSSAAHDRFLIMFDADWLNGDCIGSKIEELFGSIKPANICIRFACQEVENWLLAGKNSICQYLSVSPARCPIVDDDFAHAKEALVDLARHSRSRTIRQGIAPGPRHTAAVGPEYVPLMYEFVRNRWNLEEAIEASSSLRRACLEIAAL